MLEPSVSSIAHAVTLPFRSYVLLRTFPTASVTALTRWNVSKVDVVSPALRCGETYPPMNVVVALLTVGSPRMGTRGVVECPIGFEPTRGPLRYAAGTHVGTDLCPSRGSSQDPLAASPALRCGEAYPPMNVVVTLPAGRGPRMGTLGGVECPIGFEPTRGPLRYAAGTHVGTDLCFPRGSSETPLRPRLRCAAARPIPQ